MSKGAILLVLAASLLCISLMPGLAAMSKTDCQALWNKADKDGDGVLAAAEAQMYAEVIAGTGQKLRDVSGQKIEQDEFLVACEAGTFDKLKVD